MASVFKTESTGAAAIAAAFTVPAGRTYRLCSVTLHLDAVPTTSEDFTITLNAAAGSAYDAVLYALDLSSGSTTDLLWQPSEPLYLEGGDAIGVAYTNTDTGTHGVQITMESV